MDFKTVRGKIMGYFSIFWNKLDILSIVLFYIAILLQYIKSSDCFCGARIILAVDLSIWFIRTLDRFSAVKQLGPKLVMIGEMVNKRLSFLIKYFFFIENKVHDLKFFMLMLTVFILAFGVPAYSIIYGVEEFSRHLPRTLLNTAYWQIFGELEILDEVESKGILNFIL